MQFVTEHMPFVSALQSNLPNQRLLDSHPPTPSILMFRLATLLALATLLTFPSQAQRPGQGERGMAGGSIAGTVLDDLEGIPIEYATVAVRAEADSSLVTGGVSDASGAFSISSLPPGSYIVEVSFIGYASQFFDAMIDRRSMAVDLGTIRLAQDSAQLGEAEVTGRREFMEVQIDRTVYNVSDQPINTGGSAADVLQNVPSIEVDIDGNVSLRGNQNVAILINGRNVPMRGDFLAAFLRQLSGDAIDRVEVIPNPSARFDPDGMSGVINIILKEGNELGLSGGIQLGAGTNPGANAGANVSYQKGKWSLYGSYGFRYDDRTRTNDDLRENRFLDPTTFLLQDGIGDRTSMSHLFNTSIDYTLTRGSTLSFSGYVSRRDNTSDNATLYMEEDADRILTNLYERLTDGETNGINMDLSLGFKRSFDGAGGGDGERPSGGEGHRMGGMRMRGGGGPSGGNRAGGNGHELSLEARFNHNAGDDFDTFTEQLLDLNNNPTGAPIIETNILDNITNEGTFQLDYVRPLGEGTRLELGGKSTLRQLDNTFDAADVIGGVPVPNDTLSNAFVYDEQVHAAYGILAHQFGSIGVQAGARIEQALTDFTLENTGETFENNYFSVFPSAFATYAISEGRTVKLSYSRRINRPRTRMLNPFTSFDDPLNIRVGNPRLLPEYTDAVELTYTQFAPGFTFNATPFFRHTTNVFRRLKTLDEDTGVSTLTFENFNTSDSYGLELISSIRLGQKFNGFLSLNGHRSVTDVSNVDANLSNSAFRWTASANATFQIRPGTSVQLFGFYRAPFDIEQGRISSFSMVNLALKQDFSDRASLSIRASDVFDTMKFNYELDQPAFYQEATRRWGAQNVYATFTYTFGNIDRRNRERERRDGQEGMGGGDMEL